MEIKKYKKHKMDYDKDLYPELKYKPTRKIDTAYRDTFPLKLKEKCKSKKGCI